MTTFQHKTQPITITYSEYINLTPSQKSDFVICNSNQVTNNITNTNVSADTSDVLGLGKVAESVVVAPLAVGFALLNKIF